MFTLVRLFPVWVLLRDQVPPLAISLLVAEFFYKFHSFTLECAAFLVTWFVLDAAVHVIRRMVENRKAPTALQRR